MEDSGNTKSASKEYGVEGVKQKYLL